MQAEERPREKLMNSDGKSSTNGELIVLLIGSWSEDESDGKLGQKILAGNPQN